MTRRLVTAGLILLIALSTTVARAATSSPQPVVGAATSLIPVAFQQVPCTGESEGKLVLSGGLARYWATCRGVDAGQTGLFAIHLPVPAVGLWPWALIGTATLGDARLRQHIVADVHLVGDQWAVFAIPGSKVGFVVAGTPNHVHLLLSYPTR